MTEVTSDEKRLGDELLAAAEKMREACVAIQEADVDEGALQRFCSAYRKVIRANYALWEYMWNSGLREVGEVEQAMIDRTHDFNWYVSQCREMASDFYGGLRGVEEKLKA